MPDFYLFSGPNGAGKTTLAMKLLPAWGCEDFINADFIATGIAPFRSEKAAFKAGVLMMKLLRELASKKVDFATESTLAARAWVPFIHDCRERGYRFNLIYIWLPDAEMNVARVAARVRAGGHDIPEDVIRRRYEAGRKNFIELYRPLADTWRVLNNAALSETVIAEGGHQKPTLVFDFDAWSKIYAGYAIPNE